MANIPDFDNLGHLLFFCPDLEAIETASNICFSNKKDIEREYRSKY